MNCICENMVKDGLDMHTTTYKSVDCNGFTLRENYGTWDLQFSKDVSQRVEIFYCPFCGRRLNNWSWAKKQQ